MAVLQRVKAATTTQATSLTATLPGPATIGATQIALITVTSGSSGITMPGGWTQRATNTAQSANNFVYDRVVTATSQTSLALTLPSGGAVIYLVELDNLNGFDVAAAATSGAGPSASFATGSATPTTANSYLVTLVAHDTNTSDAFSAPVTLVDQHMLAGATSTLFHNAYAEGYVTGTTARSVTVTPAASASGWETILVVYKATVTTPVVSSTLDMDATGDGMAVDGSLTLGPALAMSSSAGFAVGAVQNASATLAAAAASALTVAGVKSRLSVLPVAGAGALAIAGSTGTVATFVAAGAGGLAVAGLETLSAVVAARGTPALAVGALRQQLAVLTAAGVSGAAIGALRTQLGTLVAAGAGSFVSNTGATAALAVRGTPALAIPTQRFSFLRVLAVRGTPGLSIGVLLVVDYHPGKRVSASILDGPGLALLTPSDVQVPVQGSDNFDTLDPARWFSMGPASQVYASGGQLVCRVNTNWNGYVQSIPAFDLNESIAAIEMVQVTQNDGDADNWFSFGNNKSYNDNNFNIDFEFGRIDCSYTLGGAFVTVAQVPYDPVVHRWVRYRIQDGVAYWEFSTDGLQWITMASWVVQFDLSAMYALIGGGFSYGAPPRDAIYDNFRVTRAAIGGSLAGAVLLNHGGNAVITRGA